MYKRALLSCLTALLFAGPSLAQQKVEPATQEIGETIRWVTKSSDVRQTYLGLDEGLHHYETKRKTRGPAAISFSWRDDLGRSVREEFLDSKGSVVGGRIYEPHNCRLTIGRCAFSEIYTNSSGETSTKEYVLITSESDGVWSSMLYRRSEAPENLTKEQTFTIDGYGMSLQAETTIHHKDYSKPKKHWTKRAALAKR